MNIRQNWMDIDRSFGGADGAGLIVLNEGGRGERVTSSLVPGWRRIDPENTNPANYLDSDFNDPSSETRTFTEPSTGLPVIAQRNRAGVDYGDFDGMLNAAASLDGFNQTSAETAARYNACVFPDGKIDGDEVCAATNGLNNEEFEQMGTQFNLSWDVTDTLQMKYLFGFNTLSYERITDDDNTGSLVHDRQFYVNHEATYRSHELQAFFDVGEKWTFTSGIFFYNAEIDQRGDLFSSVGQDRYRLPYNDATGLEAAIFGTGPMVDLFSAKHSCTQSDTPAPSCQRNYAVENPGGAALNANLVTSRWLGDDGSERRFDVPSGPTTAATDLLYATETKREAFAAYTQAVWDINETFSLTLGLRYAEDDVVAEENVFRYSELGGQPCPDTGCLQPAQNPNTALEAILGPNALATYNLLNGGLTDSDGDGIPEPTPRVVNGGIPFALSVYRPYERTDKEWDWRINLDHHITDNAMLYYSATKGHRSGGYNLLYFSQTPTYEPEEIVSYEIGYKTDWLDKTLQLNGSFYYYDYETIHTVVAEFTEIFGTTNSVLSVPGGEVTGAEAEMTWLATDRLSLGGNFSYTPSEYDESLSVIDLAPADRPTSLFPDTADLSQDIKGNQLIQVPEWKATFWGSYRFGMPGGSSLVLLGSYAYTDEVFYSPFETDAERADSYARADMRATWTSMDNRIQVSAFVNNVFDDVAVLQVLREEESEFFRRAAGVTVPRHYGLELSYKMGTY